MRGSETTGETRDSRRFTDERVPGLVVVFSGHEPLRRVLALDDGQLALGRESGGGRLPLDDSRLSRNHARVERTPSGWRIHDEGSRNGTYVDGVLVTGSITVDSPRVIRVGNTLIVPTEDAHAAVAVPPSRAGHVVGEQLAAALADISLAARTSRTLLVEGESGTGKELAARAFHAEGPARSGPFVAINGAAIPGELAERLLFGAKKGAYSGATADAGGHLDAAHRGVLFLDETGELGLTVQAKLLRAIETGEILPLGTSTPRVVDVRICAATNRDLRTRVADGHFREDLYHRLAAPSVRLPPLRERLDEIPWHVHLEITSVAPELKAHAKLVESCMLRPWPGNVRELRRSAQLAAQRARAASAAVVTLEHVAGSAGQAFVPSSAPPPLLATAAPPPEPAAGKKGGDPKVRQYAPRRETKTTREMVSAALERANGNVAQAARDLGLHRSQFYREMERWGIEGRK